MIESKRASAQQTKASEDVLSDPRFIPGPDSPVAKSERTRTSLESATDKHFRAEQSAQKDTKGPSSVRVGTWRMGRFA